MPEMTIRDLIPQIPTYFIPEKAVGINTVIQLSISGEEGGEWFVTIRDQQCRVDEGETPNPNFSLSASDQILYDLLNRKLDPVRAYMQGKVQFKGNISMAMKLAGLFKMPEGLR
jgi:putative sterol carrier protein